MAINIRTYNLTVLARYDSYYLGGIKEILDAVCDHGQNESQS